MLFPAYPFFTGFHKIFGLTISASLSYIMPDEVLVKEHASTQAVLFIFISVGQLTGSIWKIFIK
jgi:hypothetical protein